MNRRTKLFLIVMIIPIILTTIIYVNQPITTQEGVARGSGRRKNSAETGDTGNTVIIENSQYMSLESWLAYGAFFFLCLSIIFGMPYIQVELSKFTRRLKLTQEHKEWLLSRKDIINLHIDMSIAMLILGYLHFLVLAFTRKWSKYLDPTLIYPKVFLPITSFWSTNMALTLGTWSFFFFVLLSVLSYYRKELYRYISRSWFLRLKDILVLGLIGIYFHTIILRESILTNYVTLTILTATTNITVLLWGISVFMEFRKKRGKKGINKKRKEQQREEPEQKLVAKAVPPYNNGSW